MEFNNAAELLAFINEMDGYGLVVTDEDLLLESLQRAFDDMPKEG